MTRLHTTHVCVLSRRASLVGSLWQPLPRAALVCLGTKLPDKSDVDQTIPAHFPALPDCSDGQFLAAWFMPIFLTTAADSQLLFDRFWILCRKHQDTLRQRQLCESDRYFEQWMSFHEAW